MDNRTDLQKLLSVVNLSEVTRSLRVHRSTVSRWRTGERVPGRVNANRLVRLFASRELTVAGCLPEDNSHD